MKKLLPTILIILTCISSFSQETETKETIYSFVPQYLINRGIRVDIEKQLKPRHFLQVCPQFYLSEKDPGSFINQDNEYTMLIGGGMNIYHKIFAHEDFTSYGFYMSYGLIYNFFDIDYIDYSGEYQKSAHGTIHKFGADLILGYQVFIHNIFSLDMYAGLGTRISNMNAGGADTNRFNDSAIGYNFSGNLLLLGMRLGVKL